MDCAPFNYIPVPRVRYKSSHRKDDLALLAELWTHDHPQGLTHFSCAPKKKSKLFKRAVAANKSAWEARYMILKDEFPDHRKLISTENSLRVMEEATAILDDMSEKLPTDHQSAPLVDVTEAVRTNGDQWRSVRNITIMQFWLLGLRSTANAWRGDDEGAIADASEALSLLPPLDGTSFPTYHEVVLRYARSGCLQNLRRIDEAFSDLRACCASIRLLLYHGQIEIDDVEQCGALIPDTVKTAVDLRIQKGATRPLFTREERLSLEKELGIGTHSARSYCCGGCKKSPLEVKLRLCKGCHLAWFCSESCMRDSWKNHKVLCKAVSGKAKESSLERAQTTSSDDEGKLRYRTTIFENGTNTYLLCKDIETGEVFDPLTDVDLNAKDPINNQIFNSRAL